MSVLASDWIAHLGLLPHPEGGHYREIYRDPAPEGRRGALTSIYYLLREGERSAWHRVTDAAEVWHHHAGAPLALALCPDGRAASLETHILGLDVACGERPQVVVPPGVWQTAHSLGSWTLVGCIVAPAFEFSSFEMAPHGWVPR